MKKKIIISLAPVKSGDPIHKVALAEDVQKSVQTGASMCHLHSRLSNGDGIVKRWFNQSRGIYL